jgi:hypothetical protein
MTTTADLHDVTLRTAVPEDLVDVEELLAASGLPITGVAEVVEKALDDLPP